MFHSNELLTFYCIVIHENTEGDILCHLFTNFIKLFSLCNICSAAVYSMYHCVFCIHVICSFVKLNLDLYVFIYF